MDEVTLTENTQPTAQPDTQPQVQPQEQVTETAATQPEPAPNETPSEPEKPQPHDAVGDLFDEQPQDAQPQPEVLPDTYEFKDENGVDVVPEVADDYSGLARSLGLSQEKAQEFYNKTQGYIQAKMAQNNDAWAAQVENDTEIGGEHLGQTRQHIKVALGHYATPEFRALIRQSGLANHPEVVRFIARVGAALTQDTNFVSGKGTQTQKIDPYAYLDNSPELKR